jgi:hypothetical protein
MSVLGDMIMQGGREYAEEVSTSNKPVLSGSGSTNDVDFELTVADMQPEGEEGHGEIGSGDVVLSGTTTIEHDQLGIITNSFDTNSVNRDERTNYTTREFLQSMVNNGNVAPE